MKTYALISPCRDEAEYMRVTIASVVAQTARPTVWVIVDDGSTDDSPRLLADLAAEHDWVKVVTRTDRGKRAVGPGVIEAFYAGLETIDLDAFDYVCKFDLDLELPHDYFERIMQRMEDNPRIGTCRGKPYYRDAGGQLVSEKCGDETSVGMIKFYRVACFRQIGGFVREVMWDGIDCHRCRMKGWIACSWDDPELRFIHLRPMGSSQQGIMTGRMRHGFGQYFMGTSPVYMTASAVYRMTRPPYVAGGVGMLLGYGKSALEGEARYDDPEFRAFLRRYQRDCLLKGKARATRELDRRMAAVWNPTLRGDTAL